MLFAQKHVAALLLLAALIAGCSGLNSRVGAPGGRAGAGGQDTLSGEVFYRPRIALPPGATVRVRLEDVSLADASAPTLAEQTISTEGRQVPISFELRYDPDRIEPRRRYNVRAEIRGPDGALRWISDTAHPVLTRGAPSDDVRVEVVQVNTGELTRTAEALAGSEWRLMQVEWASGGTLSFDADTAYTLAFRAGGRFGGRADCNSYGGSYKVEAGGRLSLSNIAGTLAACGPDSMADTFLKALRVVSGYAVEGDRLRLTPKRAGALLFERMGASDAMEPQRTGENTVYDCTDPGGGDFAFLTRTGPGEMAVWLPARFAEDGDGERYEVLGQVRAASGAKYESGEILIWNKGAEALLAVGDARYTGCTARPGASPEVEARLRGVDFRAVGQEPGWELEIREGERIRFVYAYGERRAVTPAPAPERRDGRTTYHTQTEAHDLVVTIEDAPCTDVMSGERFPATVRVRLDGTTYRGCGQALR